MDTDLTLLQAARGLNKDALVAIFDRYSSALYRYALQLCGDPVKADDMVGDVFAKLLEQLSEGNGPETNLRSYLYQTIYHRIIDEARSARHWAPLEAAASLGHETYSTSLNLEDQIIFKQILHVIRTALTDDQRHVIFLRFLEGFSLRETAAITGKTLENVKTIQNRAIAALRRSLEYQDVTKVVSSLAIENLPGALGI